MNFILRNKRNGALNKKKIAPKVEFFNIIDEIIKDNTVQKMRDFRQHCDTSCFNHCLHVAYYSYYIAKKLNLDYKSTARAAMLHDLFLYDWRKNYSDEYKLKLFDRHAFSHPLVALKNANEIFDLNDKEQDIILKHMWPLTIKLPKYKESFIVSSMDKYSTLKESSLYFKDYLKKNKTYKYAYIFLSCLVLFRII